MTEAGALSRPAPATAGGRPRAYLDHNATTPLRPEAAAAMAAASGAGIGNPSSPHAEGRRARVILDRAREALAAAVGAPDPDRVVFTSGATEANALALRGLGRPVLASAASHAAALEHAAAGPADLVPVDAGGRVRPDALEALLRERRPAVVSVPAANNETGVLEDLEGLAALARAGGARLHVDGAQSLARGIAFDPFGAGADLVSLSAHKLGGPPGVGALALADPRLAPAEPWLRGGGQEGRRRAGTENLPGIAGFGAAVPAALATDWARVGAWRDRLEAGVRALCPEVKIAGEGAPRLSNTSCLATPGLSNEVQLLSLDLDGVAIGTGAACSSGRVEPSHVLAAMGWPPELAACSVRVSLGWTTVEADVDRFLEGYARLVARRRGRVAA